MIGTFHATTWTSQSLHTKCCHCSSVEGPTLAAAQPKSCLVLGVDDQKMVSSGVKELLIEASCHGICWEQDDETQLFNDSVLHSTEADLLICKTRKMGRSNQKRRLTWSQTNN